MNVTRFRFGLANALLLVLGCGAWHAAVAQAVKLTVGSQPYDTISYSAAVIRGLELWKKHLPPGSTVEFESALQGSIIVNAMLADKQQIGYLGDMPAVVSTTKPKQANIKLVASTGLSPGQRCNVIMVRADAPAFKSADEAVKWLDGKVVATPRGSCADRFLRQVIEMSGIKPKEVLNQSIEVIATNFRAKRIDAAALWGALGLAHRRLRRRGHRARSDHRPPV
jgi:NitT/TauT family transport system substrate-binding protein